MVQTNGFAQIFMGIPWFAWIAIVGMICSSAWGIIAQCQRHFERMAMIRQGMHPDDKSASRLEKWHDAEV